MIFWNFVLNIFGKSVISGNLVDKSLANLWFLGIWKKTFGKSNFLGFLQIFGIFCDFLEFGKTIFSKFVIFGIQLKIFGKFGIFGICTKKIFGKSVCFGNLVNQLLANM